MRKTFKITAECFELWKDIAHENKWWCRAASTNAADPLMILQTVRQAPKTTSRCSPETTANIHTVPNGLKYIWRTLMEHTKSNVLDSYFTQIPKCWVFCLILKLVNYQPKRSCCQGQKLLWDSNFLLSLLEMWERESTIWMKKNSNLLFIPKTPQKQETIALLLLKYAIISLWAHGQG